MAAQKPTQKQKNWCVTLFDFHGKGTGIVGPINTPTIEHTYAIFGREACPTSGKPHIQGFISCTSPQRFSALQKAFVGAHLTPARGTQAENRKYCSKDGDFIEFGAVHESRGEKERARWASAWDACKDNRLDDVPYDIRFRFYGTCKKIAVDHMRPLPSIPTLDNHWVCGPTGMGKSRGTKLRYPDHYPKNANKWWDGYQSQPTVIIDDFDKAHSVLGHYLKIWADHNPFLAETKGGSMLIRPKRIIVTSNWEPSEIWEDEQTLAPLLRRFSLLRVLAPVDFSTVVVVDDSVIEMIDIDE